MALIHGLPADTSTIDFILFGVHLDRLNYFVVWLLFSLVRFNWEVFRVAIATLFYLSISVKHGFFRECNNDKQLAFLLILLLPLCIHGHKTNQYWQLSETHIWMRVSNFLSTQFSSACRNNFLNGVGIMEMSCNTVREPMK